MYSSLLEYRDDFIYVVVDPGFLKEGFCSARSWEQKKKVSNFYTLFSLSPNHAFLSFLHNIFL